MMLIYEYSRMDRLSEYALGQLDENIRRTDEAVYGLMEFELGNDVSNDLVEIADFLKELKDELNHELARRERLARPLAERKGAKNE